MFKRPSFSLEQRNPLDVIESLFPPGVKTCAVNPKKVRGTLFPQEARHVARAVPKRKREFLAGRICARKALQQLGVAHFPLLVDSDRTPIWPEGIIGTISHTDDCCAAAVAHRGGLLSLGIDIEDIRQVQPSLHKLICTSREFRRLYAFSQEEQTVYGALLFSAKECFYKCQYMLTKQWFDFQDVEVIFHSDFKAFEVKVLDGPDCVSIYDRVWRGRYVVHANTVVTGMSISRIGGRC